jgi:tRNA threonylcarbamoyl adenosine modification protein YeaZ
VDERGVLAHSSYAQPGMHAEHLLDHVELAMKSAGCARHHLGKIAVGIGPGNFTGLRVGIALASGIGLGLNIGVVGVCSLASMASAIVAPEIGVRFIVRDARRGEVFCAAFTNHGESLIAPTLVGTSQLFEWLSSHSGDLANNGVQSALAGDGLQWLSVQEKDRLEAFIPDGAESLWPDATQTALIGSRLQTSQTIAPDYVRDADAKMPNLTRNPLLNAEGPWGVSPDASKPTPR